MKGLNAITHEIIENAFPELRVPIITAHYAKIYETRDCHMKIRAEIPFVAYNIYVDRKLKTAPRPVLEGGIAHELVHISETYSLLRIIQNELVKLVTRTDTKEERRVDLDVVERGYGPQLLRFAKYIDRKGYETGEDVGLSIRELEKLLRK